MLEERSYWIRNAKINIFFNIDYCNNMHIYMYVPTIRKEKNSNLISAEFYRINPFLGFVLKCIQSVNLEINITIIYTR